jgi:hypothetical protein
MSEASEDVRVGLWCAAQASNARARDEDARGLLALELDDRISREAVPFDTTGVGVALNASGEVYFTQIFVAR